MGNYQGGHKSRSAYNSNRGGKFGGGGRGRGGGGNRGGGGKRRGQYIDPKRFVKEAKYVEQVVYQPQNAFADFAFSDILKENLRNKGYVSPTQIQDHAIPIALQNKDVVGIANTGTGKTAAFLLPLLDKIINGKGEKALIVAPTRELALQIETECRDFAKGTGLLGVLLIGGVPIGPQLRSLRHKPEIFIGTPGRIKDHIERGTLDMRDVTTAVLDEVDRMLDMGFINDIRSILSELPDERQSLFFSATMSPTIEGLIRTFTKNPETIMARTAETSDNVEQRVEFYVEGMQRMDKLHDILATEEVSKALVFGETKRAVERLSNDLVQRGFKADAMHGGKSQGQRQRALKNFKQDKINILVATDVAARGIDVDGVSHVVNFDVPQTYDDYTHRIGRTGRGGNTGNAITFVQKY